MNCCPRCKGNKESIVFVNTGIDSSGHYQELQKCGLCKGDGVVSDEVIANIEKGKELRQVRISQGLTILQAAQKEGISSSEVSQRELGNFKKNR